MKLEYRDRLVEIKVFIDGIDYTREWANTDIDDAKEFAMAWIDSEKDERNG